MQNATTDKIKSDEKAIFSDFLEQNGLEQRKTVGETAQNTGEAPQSQPTEVPTPFAKYITVLYMLI